MHNFKLEDVFDTKAPYLLDRDAKRNIFIDHMNRLSHHHKLHCAEYKTIVSGLGFNKDAVNLNDVPYIPVRLFKLLNLMSVSRNDIFKQMTSSGTSGQAVSKIYLDKPNASRQSLALRSIMGDFLGSDRLPMMIVDTDDIIKNRNKFNARAAGVLGFSMFGRNHSYSLDETMKAKVDSINSFIEEYSQRGIFIFGFTFIIWQFLHQFSKDMSIPFNFGHKSMLLHGGGWKKLMDQSVSNEVFKSQMSSQLGINKVHSYYGMVEQTGSIFVECEHGYLHSPVYADIIVRDPVTYKPCEVKQPGIIQVLSAIPTSYPGHSLLTEDEGMLIGEDDCKCGRNGKYFTVFGRMKGAEARGCSDTRQV